MEMEMGMSIFDEGPALQSRPIAASTEPETAACYDLFGRIQLAPISSAQGSSK